MKEKERAREERPLAADDELGLGSNMHMYTSSRLITAIQSNTDCLLSEIFFVMASDITQNLSLKWYNVSISPHIP